MAARPTWKGFLKISQVTIPVRVYPATDAAATLSFNQLHGACQTRIQQKKWCPQCEREVERTELVKGYEFERGRYVVLQDEDIAKARPESTRIINLVRFADAASIDPIYLERPYYLAPDGAVAAEAFAVVRDAIRGKAGIGKLALYGREYLVAVLPRERGLVMFTLRQAKEVRSMGAIDELAPLPAKVKPDCRHYRPCWTPYVAHEGGRWCPRPSTISGGRGRCSTTPLSTATSGRPAVTSASPAPCFTSGGARIRVRETPGSSTSARALGLTPMRPRLRWSN